MVLTMLPSLDNYIHLKNLRHRLIHFRDIDTQIIMQSG